MVTTKSVLRIRIVRSWTKLGGQGLLFLPLWVMLAILILD